MFLSGWTRRKVDNISISNKVKYVLLAVCVFISIIFVTVNYFITGSWLQDVILQNYSEITTKQFEFIEYWMERRAEHIEKLSQSPVIIDAAAQLNQSGRLNPAAYTNLKKYIDDVMYDQGCYSWILLIDRNGNIGASSDSRQGLLDKKLFSQIPKRHDIHILQAYIETQNGKKQVIQPVSFPVFSNGSRNGSANGFIICAINLNEMDDSLSILNLGKNGNAFIIDSKGRVLCSSRDYEFESSIDAFGDYHLASTDTAQQSGFRLMNQETRMPVKSVSSCLESGHAGHDTYINHENRTVIGIWKWLSYFQWMFLIEIEKSDAYAAITRTIVIYAFISLFFIAASVAIAILLSRDINRSISAFMDSFGRGALGDLSVRYPVRDESTMAVFTRTGDGYSEYDRNRGFCFFEIGSIAHRLGKETTCKLILDNTYKSCTQCSIYKDNMKNEMHTLGIWFNLFISKINEVVGNTLSLSHELFSSSDEMSVAISDFSVNANTQAASAEEIMANVQALISGFANISDRVEDENISLKTMMHRIAELTGIIDSMGQKVQKTQIDTDTFTGKAKYGERMLNEMNRSMIKISDSSGEVMNIIQIINDISDQINLLSLNASIEAARAGEQGRGFAVVAAEISKLADQTASSIKQIDSLIKVNNNEITKGLANVQDTVHTIASIIDGFNLISSMMKEVSDIMETELEIKETVVDEMDSLKERSDAIKNATQEQMLASDEITNAVEVINDTTQHIAARAEELAATSENMRDQAEMLNQSIIYFDKSGTRQ